MGFNRNSHWWLKYFAYVLSAALHPVDFYINLYKQRLNHFGVFQGEGRVKDCPFLKAVLLNYEHGLCTSQNCRRDRCCHFQMYRGKANIAKQRCTCESILRSRARGVVPGSTRCFLWLSTGEDIKSSYLSGPSLQPPAQKTDLVAPMRAAKGMYEYRKACLPCRKAVRHAHKGKCPTVYSCPTGSARKGKAEFRWGRRRQERGLKRKPLSLFSHFFSSLSSLSCISPSPLLFSVFCL